MILQCFCFKLCPISFGHPVKLIKIFLEVQSNDIFASVTFPLGQLASVINESFFILLQEYIASVRMVMSYFFRKLLTHLSFNDLGIGLYDVFINSLDLFEDEIST